MDRERGGDWVERCRAELGIRPGKEELREWGGVAGRWKGVVWGPLDRRGNNGIEPTRGCS